METEAFFFSKLSLKLYACYRSRKTFENYKLQLSSVYVLYQWHTLCLSELGKNFNVDHEGGQLE